MVSIINDNHWVLIINTLLGFADSGSSSDRFNAEKHFWVQELLMKIPEKANPTLICLSNHGLNPLPKRIMTDLILM